MRHVDAFALELLAQKRPCCSLPTRAISATFSPRRDAPIAMFAGQPPTYFANELTSSIRQPACSP